MRFFKNEEKIKEKDYFSFTKGMYYLLKGKISLVNALEIISGNYKENFKNKILENISEKDFEEFSDILTVYEQENGSVIYTAEKLFMHKNTLQYKLNKIKRLSGYDPRNLKDFTILSLAFKLKNLE